MSYDGLTDTSKAVATYIEMSYRQRYLELMAAKLPSLQIPAKFTDEVEALFHSLPTEAARAVLNFLEPPKGRSMGHGIYDQKIWKTWLYDYLKTNPRDQTLMQQLEQRFTDPDLEHIDWQLQHEV